MEENVIINSEIAMNLTNEEVVKAMSAKDDVVAIKGHIKKIVVNDLTTSKKGYDFYPVTITLEKPIPCYLPDDNGNYELKESTLVYTSVDILSAVMREDKSLAGIVNSISKSPSVIELLLTDADVEILQQDIPANTKFVNPFSTVRDVSEYTHAIKSNSIINIKLSNEGQDNVRSIKSAILASCLR